VSQSHVSRYSPPWCIRSFGLFGGFSAILKYTFVRCVPACIGRVQTIAVLNATYHQAAGTPAQQQYPTSTLEP
jgi:hypothetical protein